jgi:hypothetical protein
MPDRAARRAQLAAVAQVDQDLDLAGHPADPQQQIAARSPSLLIAHNDAHTMPRMAHRHCALLAAAALSGACATTGGKITVDVQ